MSEEQQQPLGKSPYARKKKRPYRYEAIDHIEAAKATGDQKAEERAKQYFDDHIKRTHGWDPRLFRRAK